MNIEKNNINVWVLKEKELLEKIANDISRKFWIEKNKAKHLIEQDTISWIESLKNELLNEPNKLNEKQLEELFFIIKWALELIKNSSKLEIKFLREDVEKSINIDDFANILEWYLPNKLILKAKNPQQFHEHILGFTLWSANSIIASLEFLYKLWKWIIQMPYHLYLVVSWKGETNSFRDI